MQGDVFIGRVGCFSYAPPGLVAFLALTPRLVPWAAIFRRIAARFPAGRGAHRRAGRGGERN